MPEWFVQLMQVAAAPAAVYAGIRYDLGQLREKAQNAAAAASSAHRRIDGLMERRA